MLLVGLMDFLCSCPPPPPHAHTLGVCQLGGFASGSWSTQPNTLSNSYFTTLLGQAWTAEPVPASTSVQYTNPGDACMSACLCAPVCFQVAPDVRISIPAVVMMSARADPPPCILPDHTLFLTPSDVAIAWDDSTKALAQGYAQDNQQFLADFGRCARHVP